MNRLRPLLWPIVALAVALGSASVVASKFSARVLDALTPDAPRVDDRILVVGFGGREAFDGNSRLLWPAHRRGIYLRDLATAASQGGAAAVVFVGYDSLALLDGSSGRDALANSPIVQRLGIIPLQEVGLYEPRGALPLATHYRVDDLSSAVAGVGLPLGDTGGGVVRTVPMLARTLPLTVGSPPVNVPPAGRSELATDATNVVPSLALRARLAEPDAGVLSAPTASSVTLGTTRLPLENGSLRVRWSRALNDAEDPTVVPVIDVLGDGLSPQAYRGKIVLVGTTDATQTDFVDTPVGRMPEVLAQANVLNTLLTRPFERPAPAWMAWLAAAVAAGAMLLLWRRRPALATGMGVVLIAGWFVGARFVAGHGRLVDPLVVPVTVAATLVALGVRRLIKVVRDRRKLRDLFSQYVPASVARELVESGDARKAAAGARLTVSVLFCDLRGFTSTAARLTPSQVRELLDCYYEALSPVILQRGGTVMQYTGDEIFAVFGAPTPMAASGGVALETAQEMFDLLPTLNRQLAQMGLPPVNYGIGVHTGAVVAAHVGSQIRRQYAVMGDTVNVGNRFCSLAREGQIAYSEQTRESCSVEPPGEPVASVNLKGVAEPVTAYVIQALAAVSATGS